MMKDIYEGHNLIVVPMRTVLPEDWIRFDVTSRNSKYRKYLSPFYLGPIKSWDGIESKTMENLWQFSKVYPSQVDDNLNPTEEWWNWRKDGFEDCKAHRHTFARDVKPLYNFWNNEKLGYIDSRKKVYIPAYYRCVMKDTTGLDAIKNLLDQGKKVAIVDFDGFNFIKNNMDITELIEDSTHIMGHGHVLYTMIKRPDVIKNLVDNCGW